MTKKTLRCLSRKRSFIQGRGRTVSDGAATSSCAKSSERDVHPKSQQDVPYPQCLFERGDARKERHENGKCVNLGDEALLCKC